ncbi:DUF4097 family beta strand repeat-containing protein [Halobacillus sp. Cin3]|uniref:DUF4097 family beta strand repeat-containing protein n=1 Tax=Halobacillus sp. Cin3 TaxID=2928441 RepID=UPI00248E669F|nr:DUF4097 family beta strand repeat-containing protein [Halobacillus sp. Cin3]
MPVNEERMKILEMIEKGTINAEEGAKLLSALEREGEDQPEKKKYGIVNFLDDAVDKIKNADFDLAFGESVEIKEDSLLDAGDLKEVDLMIANGSLHVYSWEEDQVKASSRIKVYQAASEEEAKERVYGDVQFDIKYGLLRLASPSKKIKMHTDLYLPKRSYEFIKAQLQNGPLHAEGLEGEHFHLKTSNGSVKGARLKGRSCKIHTANGLIKLEEGVFDQLEADTINGPVTLEGTFGKIDGSSVSGGITVDHKGSTAHTAFLKTTAGAIQVSLPVERKVDGILKTKFGSLQCSLDNYKILKDKKDVMNKTLEFEAYEQFEDVYHIEAETKTGSVKVQPPVQL